ncbi:hypothetical protein EVAR_79582_1 [Eumeta japonica]|uniref:Uncharacterized protein n=1 Tax=Eumeta variegata TaxID=151549 RepID=A0A4C1UE71_EUMVA|nr:hypothetical protein EVAR_79582_1 [Eumeta japonica]
MLELSGPWAALQRICPHEHLEICLKDSVLSNCCPDPALVSAFNTNLSPPCDPDSNVDLISNACLQYALTCGMQPTADPRICLSTTNLYPND